MYSGAQFFPNKAHSRHRFPRTLSSGRSSKNGKVVPGAKKRRIPYVSRHTWWRLRRIWINCEGVLRVLLRLAYGAEPRVRVSIKTIIFSWSVTPRVPLSRSRFSETSGEGQQVLTVPGESDENFTAGTP